LGETPPADATIRVESSGDASGEVFAGSEAGTSATFVEGPTVSFASGEPEIVGVFGSSLAAGIAAAAAGENSEATTDIQTTIDETAEYGDDVSFAYSAASVMGATGGYAEGPEGAYSQSSLDLTADVNAELVKLGVLSGEATSDTLIRLVADSNAYGHHSEVDIGVLADALSTTSGRFEAGGFAGADMKIPSGGSVGNGISEVTNVALSGETGMNEEAATEGSVISRSEAANTVRAFYVPGVLDGVESDSSSRGGGQVIGQSSGNVFEDTLSIVYGFTEADSETLIDTPDAFALNVAKGTSTVNGEAQAEESGASGDVFSFVRIDSFADSSNQAIYLPEEVELSEADLEYLGVDVVGEFTLSGDAMGQGSATTDASGQTLDQPVTRLQSATINSYGSSESDISSIDEEGSGAYSVGYGFGQFGTSASSTDTPYTGSTRAVGNAGAHSGNIYSGYVNEDVDATGSGYASGYSRNSMQSTTNLVGEGFSKAFAVDIDGVDPDLIADFTGVGAGALGATMTEGWIEVRSDIEAFGSVDELANTEGHVEGTSNSGAEADASVEVVGDLSLIPNPDLEADVSVGSHSFTSGSGRAYGEGSFVTKAETNLASETMTISDLNDSPFTVGGTGVGFAARFDEIYGPGLGSAFANGIGGASGRSTANILAGSVKVYPEDEFASAEVGGGSMARSELEATSTGALTLVEDVYFVPGLTNFRVVAEHDISASGVGSAGGYATTVGNPTTTQLMLDGYGAADVIGGASTYLRNGESTDPVGYEKAFAVGIADAEGQGEGSVYTLTVGEDSASEGNAAGGAYATTDTSTGTTFTSFPLEEAFYTGTMVENAGYGTGFGASGAEVSSLSLGDFQWNVLETASSSYGSTTGGAAIANPVPDFEVATFDTNTNSHSVLMVEGMDASGGTSDQSQAGGESISSSNNVFYSDALSEATSGSWGDVYSEEEARATIATETSTGTFAEIGGDGDYIYIDENGDFTGGYAAATGLKFMDDATWVNEVNGERGEVVAGATGLIGAAGAAVGSGLYIQYMEDQPLALNLMGGGAFGAGSGLGASLAIAEASKGPQGESETVVEVGQAGMGEVAWNLGPNTNSLGYGRGDHEEYTYTDVQDYFGDSFTTADAEAGAKATGAGAAMVVAGPFEDHVTMGYGDWSNFAVAAASGSI
jgi:hypothetical protein